MIYQPAEDSFLLSEAVKKYSKGKSVLDIGSGSGIQAIIAKKSGAVSVLASDINPESVKLIKANGIPAVCSDLFSKISGKFDLIIFNPPYLPEDKNEDKQSSLATTGGKRGDEIIIRFLSQSKAHLSKKGAILILLSSLTPKSRILKTLKSLDFSYNSILKEKIFMEYLEVWEIKRKL